MAEDNTVIIVVGVAVLAFMGFLCWKSMQPQQTVSLQTLQPKTTLTEFVRDENGYIKQIIERG